MASDQPVSHVTPMAGVGAYNRGAVVQSAQAVALIPLLEAAVRRIPVDQVGPPLVVADFGCSQGANSMAPMRAAIAALRERAGGDRPICVVHNDLPGNDYASLFTLLEQDPASYLRNAQGVFASAVGRSFFEQVLPPDTVTVGWSSNSVHWFNHVPHTAPDAWYPPDTAIPEVRAGFERQSAEDWRRFLKHRGMELRLGGRLLVMMGGADESGPTSWGALRRHLQAERAAILEAGALTEMQSARMLIPNRMRCRDEIVAPFGAEGSFAGLAIEHLDIVEAPDPIWDFYQEIRDAAAFGARWGAVFRVTFAPSLTSTLDADLRAVVTQRLEQGIARRFAAEPEPNPMLIARVVLAKVGSTT